MADLYISKTFKATLQKQTVAIKVLLSQQQV